MSNRALRKCIHLNKCMSPGSRLVCWRMTWTTASLSQRTKMFLWVHSWPQMATASTIGTSSLSAMFLSAQLGGHGAISQFDRQTAAQPHFPDASVEHISSCGPEPWTRSIEVPFHLVRNSFHHNKSERNSWFRCTQ